MFLHSRQLHFSELHNTPIWKHSQYFFWHPDFLHLQPVTWAASICLLFLRSLFFCSVFCIPSFGLKACGFRFFMDFLIDLIYSIFIWLFMHPLQLQFLSQNLPLMKHSQYILRHLLFLQLHIIFFSLFSLTTDSSFSISICFSKVFFPRPRALRVPPDVIVYFESNLWKSGSIFQLVFCFSVNS